MMKSKYDRIVEQFENYYPYLYKQAIDWWPSGRLCITVKLNDGELFEFDSVGNTIRKVKTDNDVRDVENLRKDIGRNLQKMISTRSIPQSQIAERVGISEAMLSRYLHGTSTPGIDKLINLAAVLGCRTSDIIGELHNEKEEINDC